MPKSSAETKVSKKPKREPKGIPVGTRLPQAHGGTLVVGAGGGPQPGAGRPPDEWRAKLRAFASRDEVMAHVETVLLAGPSHPFFDRALQYATDHGYGRPHQTLDVNATISVADRLTEARQRALQRGVVEVDAKMLDSGEVAP